MKPTIYKNLALASLTAAVLTACSSGGTCGSCAVPVPAGSKLIFVAPSILPSLANTTGINYMGVYNPTNTAINNISYSLGQIVGSGSSVTLDQNSAKTCANIAAKSSCFLKLSVPESTIAGGAVVTASNSDGTEAATPLAIGVQQVPYVESANANGVGLYFYPKAQYSESGVPFMLATAVVQSPNVGNINTIELVDESGNLIAGQYVTSGNSGAGAATLTMGSVVQIVVPLPQGVNLSQNYKVRTSYQSAPSTLSTIAEKLGLANKQTQATSNQTTGTQIYTVTTQGDNINLQLTPNQVYLTANNPIQYGYLYNIGNLTASQIQVSSSSPNVRVTAADAILNGQRVIKVTYELINTTVAPATNTVTVTAQNPAGQTQTSTGNTNQNVSPDIVPTPSPKPTPSPTPTPPGPPSLNVTTNAAVIAGAECRDVTVTAPSSVTSDTTVTVTINPASASSYGFGSGPSAGSFSDTATCTIFATSSSCTIGDGNGLCAATGSAGSSFTAIASATGYSNGTQAVTVASAKNIFVTDNFSGGADLPAVAANLSLGSFTDGFQAGDAICQHYATNNSFAGTYKALIAGTNRQPGGSDWVIHPSTLYVRASDGITAIGTSTAGAQLPATLTNTISSSVSTPALNGFAVNSDPWVLDTTYGNCSNWTSATSGTWVYNGSPTAAIAFGTGGLPPQGLGYLGAPGLQIGCNSVTSVLYCVQQ